jgi:hypothetical protein
MIGREAVERLAVLLKRLLNPARPIVLGGALLIALGVLVCAGSSSPAAAEVTENGSNLAVSSVNEWDAPSGSTLDNTEAAPIQVVGNQTESGIHVTLDATGAISGHVYEGDGTTPVEGADVMAAGPDHSYAYHVSTATDGSYTLDGLPSNTYRVQAVAEHRIREWYWQAYNHWAADLVTVEAPTTTTDIDFTLDLAGSISGHVYEQDAVTPVSDAWIMVSATAPEWDQLASFCCTGPDGSYTVNHLRAGPAYVKTDVHSGGQHPNLIDEWYAEGGSTPDGN